MTTKGHTMQKKVDPQAKESLLSFKHFRSNPPQGPGSASNISDMQHSLRDSPTVAGDSEAACNWVG